MGSCVPVCNPYDCEVAERIAVRLVYAQNVRRVATAAAGNPRKVLKAGCQ